MPQFHETGYGRLFFQSQLPDLIKQLTRIADALEAQNKMKENANSLNDIPVNIFPQASQRVKRKYHVNFSNAVESYKNRAVTIETFDSVEVESMYDENLIQMQLGGLDTELHSIQFIEQK